MKTDRTRFCVERNAFEVLVFRLIIVLTKFSINKTSIARRLHRNNGTFNITYNILIIIIIQNSKS